MKSENEIHVRTAEPSDEEGIMGLARLVNAENGVFRMDENKVLNLVRPSLYLQGGIIGVIGPKDYLEGVVVLRISEYWYSNSSFLEEMPIQRDK